MRLRRLIAEKGGTGNATNNRMPIRMVVLLISALALCRCGECTLIGCLDGVIVRPVDADGERLMTYTATLTIGQRSTTFRCPTESGVALPPGTPFCSAGEVFVEAAPTVDEGHLQIDAAEGRFDAPVDLDFEPQFPNGRSCGQVCSQAELRIRID